MQKAKPDKNSSEKTRTSGILITGAPRSGTTWAGKVFASVPRTFYVHEPFNPITPSPFSPLRFEDFFYRLDEDQNARELNYLQDLVNIRCRRCSFRLSDLRHLKWTLSRMKFCSKGLLGIAGGDRAIIKDPIAIMSADILCRKLDIKPLFMVRNPAACVSSLFIRNWKTDFKRMARYADRLEEIIPGEIDLLRKLAEDPDHDLIVNAAFLWRISNLAIIRYLDHNPDWMITLHEDLIEDPTAAFKMLFRKFDLLWTDETQSFIESLSSSSSPAQISSEQEKQIHRKQGRKKTGKRRDVPLIFNINRDLTEIKDVARNRLNSDQIKLIKDMTQDVFEHISDLSSKQN